MNNRDIAAIFDAIPGFGGIAGHVINEDMDSKKYVEDTNYSEFNPSVGRQSGVAGTKDVNRELVDRSPGALTKTLEKIAPFSRMAETAAITVGAGALAGPAVGKIAGGLYQSIQDKVKDKKDNQEYPYLNTATEDLNKAQKDLYGQIESEDKLGDVPTKQVKEKLPEISSEQQNLYNKVGESFMSDNGISEVFKNELITF